MVMTGVYSVNIHAEQQLVIVSGRVDSTTLIKKLEKSGKHAELWSAGPNNKLVQEQPNSIDNNQMQYLSNGFNFSQNQAYLGNEIEDLGSFGNYFGPNVGIETVGGEMGQTLMASAPAAYQDSEINRFQDYAARTNPPSRMSTNMGHIYHNYASTEMPSNIYMQY
ncbi:hypothetical protein HS088_TW05G00177 [Tripterygium wilfordii]|uniref:Heavy metal transport/detoxification superfamily protein n=1 Tax=Tripterygium wilfordii TaxID=458696 RepID=A0A7J7DMZ8_TRIWF|nr:hypothetical protein HS088_TW05G00177 [Tripterygium wilfordii]